MVSEYRRTVQDAQQRQADSDAEQMIKRDAIRWVERARQLAEEANLNLGKHEDQIAFIKLIGERLTTSGDPGLAWEHVNFEGDFLPIRGGIPDLRWADIIPFIGSNWNDKISSIQVWNGAVWLFEHNFYRGSSLFTGGVGLSEQSDFTQIFTPDGNSWNDRASSIVASIF